MVRGKIFRLALWLTYTFPSHTESELNIESREMLTLKDIEEARHIAQPEAEGWRDTQYRRISIFLSVPFARTGVSANEITVTWCVLGFLGTVALASSHYWFRIGGACLLEFSELLDYVDGEVARLTGHTSSAGIFLEVVGHQLRNISLFLAVGFGVFRKTDNLLYLLLAFCATTFASGYQPELFQQQLAKLGTFGNESRARNDRASVLRKLLSIFFLTIRLQTELVVFGTITDSLAFVLLYYGITKLALFVWRTHHFTLRLIQVEHELNNASEGPEKPKDSNIPC